jgi:hypothetical protein
MAEEAKEVQEQVLEEEKALTQSDDELAADQEELKEEINSIIAPPNEIIQRQSPQK